MVINGQRVRKWSSKTRNGCRTCRLRRIKCDENRPQCLKCSSTGRSCEGYEVPVVQRNDASRRTALLPKQDIQNNKIGIRAALSGLSGDLSGQEVQTFTYFRLHAAGHLSGLFSCPVWNHLMVQGSHQEPAVLHACIAVGALYQTRSTWIAELGLYNFDSSPYTAMALSQYSKALSSLRNFIDRQDGKGSNAAISVVLMTCLLFVVIEMLQGQTETVNFHLIQGLKVLAEHYNAKSVPRLSELVIARQYSFTSHVKDLAEVFIRLDTDSTMFRRQSPYCQPALPKLGFEVDIPCRFESLKEAKDYLDTLSCMAFGLRGDLLKVSEQRLTVTAGTPRDCGRHYCTAYAKLRRMDKTSFPHLVHHRHALLRGFQRWDLSLAAMGTQDRQTILHMRVAKFLPYFILSTLLDSAEILSDRFEAEFQQTLDMAIEFVDLSEHGGEIYKFVPEAGVLASIYIIAIKCRNSSIRRKAVSLLHGSIVQEGLWSGCVYGKFVDRFIELEESRAKAVFGPGDECNYIPEEARFSDVIMDTGPGKPWNGNLFCARYLDETGDELEVYEEKIDLTF